METKLIAAAPPSRQSFTCQPSYRWVAISCDIFIPKGKTKLLGAFLLYVENKRKKSEIIQESGNQ
jgi:hypothetical protein